MIKGGNKNSSPGQNLPEFELVDFAMNKVHEAVFLISENARFH